MLDFLNKIIPNVMHSTDRLLDSILATLQMTLWSGVVMFVCGLFLGVVLTVTREGGIMQRKALYQVLDKLINVCRSIPFVIFIAILLPVTKAIMGTKIGVRGVIVPLLAASVPFFARQVESALAHVEHGLIEAAESMGKSPVNIIFTVYLYESIPAIARGTTIKLINLIGMTTDEAVPAMEKYLDDAYLAHLPQVRVVHGRGTGALRAACHKRLKKLNYVKEFRLGEYGEGDTGVTIVVFK